MVSRARSFAVFQLLLIGSFVEMPGTARAQRAKEQPPVLTAFVINGGADSASTTDVTVVLAHTVVGTRPSEFRVSRRADFSGAQWQPYVAPLSSRDWYDATGPSCDAARPSHRVTLYLQVRAAIGDEVRVIDGQRQLVPARVESNVLRASVCARAPSSDEVHSAAAAEPATHLLDGLRDGGLFHSAAHTPALQHPFP